MSERMKDMKGSSLSEAVSILEEPFEAGSRVTNCVVHMSQPLNERPRSCERCTADIVNQLQFAIRVNEFLNDKVDRARNCLLKAATD